MAFRARIGLVSRDAAGLQRALDIYLAAAVADALHAPNGLPRLYDSGIRYDKLDNDESWQLPTTTLERLAGDCEDLSAYRAAELRLAGVQARIVAYRSGPGVLHAVVRLPDGTIDDPSRRLGMR